VDGVQLSTEDRSGHSEAISSATGFQIVDVSAAGVAERVEAVEASVAPHLEAVDLPDRRSKSHLLGARR